MSTHHVMPIEILFKHCDPAGIVFYPRYVEMLNDTIEHWFKHGLNISFYDLKDGGVKALTPTVSLQVDFEFPSRLGDELESVLSVESLGRSSIKTAIILRGKGPEGVTRLRARVVLVCVDAAQLRPLDIPAELRERIEQGGYVQD